MKIQLTKKEIENIENTIAEKISDGFSHIFDDGEIMYIVQEAISKEFENELGEQITKAVNEHIKNNMDEIIKNKIDKAIRNIKL